MTPSFNIRSSGSWAISHLNLNKDKQQLPVLLHFHFSRERIALAGAKNAKALAWNRGNLVERERRDGDILWGHCSGVAQTTFYWVIQLENRRISHQKKTQTPSEKQKDFTSQRHHTTPTAWSYEPGNCRGQALQAGTQDGHWAGEQGAEHAAFTIPALWSCRFHPFPLHDSKYTHF